MPTTTIAMPPPAAPEAPLPAPPSDMMVRSVRVIPPEKENGGTEYKRRVAPPTASRLRSLATQMSYRLDEGRGRCTYEIGVEDDGCHSLLDYTSVAESARVAECIGRSLNAAVLQRRMIQGEVVRGLGGADDDGDDGKWTLRAAASAAAAGEDGGQQQHHQQQRRGLVIEVDEPAVLGGGDEYQPRFDDVSDTTATDNNNNNVEDEKEEKTYCSEHEKGEQQQQQAPRRVRDEKLLSKDDGTPTRCVLVLQRVETHLLDAPSSPVSLERLALPLTKKDRSESSVSDGIADSAEATTIARATASSSVAAAVDGNSRNPSAARAAAAAASTGSSENGGGAATTRQRTKHSVSETLSKHNVRIAVVGNVDAGKSTLIGSLTTSTLDDGRGRCRTSIMKHRHEIESGRTSTAASHLLGFKHTGETVCGRDRVRGQTLKVKSEDEVAREADKVCTLLDLAGHEKYLKTTIHGVSSGMCDYGLILVNGRHPPTHMTRHHLNLCASFGIPVVVIFTKLDGCPDHALKNSREEVYALLRGPDVGKIPFAVRNESDVQTCSDKLHTLAPVLETSCVTGEGMELLRKLLFALPKRRRHERKVDRPFEFLVEDVFNVPGVGAVVSGFVNAGELTVGTNAAAHGHHHHHASHGSSPSDVYVGPLDDGTYLRTAAKSAHMARINTARVSAGQSACLALSPLSKDLRKKLRRGMVVLRSDPTSARTFDAEICVLKGEGTTIRKSYQAYVHILNVRQSAYARRIELVTNAALAGLPVVQQEPTNHRGGHRGEKDKDDENNDDDDDGIVLRPGSRAKVRFEFAKRPEYIRPGMRMLFRDGRVRGVGIVTDVHCHGSGGDADGDGNEKGGEGGETPQAAAQ